MTVTTGKAESSFYLPSIGPKECVIAFSRVFLRVSQLLLKSRRSMSCHHLLKVSCRCHRGVTPGHPQAYVSVGLATNAEVLEKEGPHSFVIINVLRLQLCLLVGVQQSL